LSAYRAPGDPGGEHEEEMAERVLIVGLDEPEFTQIQERIDLRVTAHEALPLIMVRDGELLVEPRGRAGWLPVSKVVYHSIYGDDLDFIAALALWGGPCFPNPRAMMDCRLKLPCLVRALQYTRFGGPPRGYAAPGATYRTDRERVAKWGNWHCGENKARFNDAWTGDEPAIIEEFLPGQAVRVAIIGDHYWQIRLEGEGWLKSIHPENAAFMEVDPELLEDTRHVQAAFGLDLIANDYIVTEQGTKHLLEVNHIPNVTRFPEMWEAYREHTIAWIQESL
jgi:hypothetical protein